MRTSTGRCVLAGILIVVGGMLAAKTSVCGQTTSSGEQEAAGRPIPMIHVTDLFRPHDDPDDHWDLACVYALACQGRVDLRGILIDYPKPERKNDPDVLGVAQMNYLTGKSVPVMVGSPRWIEPREAAKSENESALRGVRTLLNILRHSPEPVVINILGSCRDVALAGKLEPDLFARKCAAIYLNAGSGTPDEAKAARLEWNVRLDPGSYVAIFEIPCPIYWLPCFEEVRQSPRELFQVAEYGSFYRFKQDDVLPHLSDGMQKFFAYVFKHGRFEQRHQPAGSLGAEWLQYLAEAKDEALLARVREMDRNMWCTGGFLHAVGQTVAEEGKVVPLADARNDVFTFDPIRVSCSADGVTRWQPDPASSNRFIFHVRNRDRYAAAMTAALRTLLRDLP